MEEDDYEISLEEVREAMSAMARRISIGGCATGIFSALSDAKHQYHQGLPVRDDVDVDEAVLELWGDWKEVGSSYNTEGNETIIKWFEHSVIAGKEVRIRPLHDIEGFVPEEGHSYKLSVRRFSKCSHCWYEVIEVLEDNPVSPRRKTIVLTPEQQELYEESKRREAAFYKQKAEDDARLAFGEEEAERFY